MKQTIEILFLLWDKGRKDAIRVQVEAQNIVGWVFFFFLKKLKQWEKSYGGKCNVKRPLSSVEKCQFLMEE